MDYNKNKTIILTVGLPRSGKSTWSRAQGIPVVNPDSIRFALYNKPYIEEAEEMVWAITFIMAKALLLAGHDKIIIDATNLKEKNRGMWHERFPDYIIKYKCFRTTMRECIKRAKECKRKDLIPVIKRMYKEAEWPGLIGEI